MLRALLVALRPAQWAKNVFVLAPVVFAERLHDQPSVLRALAAFGLFCAASSAVYLVNDLADRAADRRHPLKRQRPIASGALPAGTALVTAVVLAAAALLGGRYLGHGVLLILALYVALQLLYSYGLKRVVILDVMVVALGFVLRVLGGGVAVRVPVSGWLVLCTLLLALFLTLSKRRHELTLLAEETPGQRSVLSHYSPGFLDQMINVVTASTLMAYAFWALGTEADGGAGTDALLWTVPLVLFGIFRYLYLVYQRPAEHSPTEALMGDWPFLLNLALWAGLVVWIFQGG